jgi:hypothetical protein
MNDPQNSNPHACKFAEIKTQLHMPSFTHQRSSADLPPEVIQVASANWQVFPVQATGSFAVATALLEEATDDLVQLESWAQDLPGCNWALATGQKSEVFAVQMDDACGRDALYTLSWYASDWIQTRQVMAGERLVALFRWPSGFGLCNASKRIAPGLSIHGDGDYVLIPPSKSSSGISYRWLDSDESVAATPQWLLDELFIARGDQTSESVLPLLRESSQRIAATVQREGKSMAKILPFPIRDRSR